MNKKLLSYEDAVEELKVLEVFQRYSKMYKRRFKMLGKDESKSSKDVHVNKTRINKLLTIIHLHKETRKMWHQLHKKEASEAQG